MADQSTLSDGGVLRPAAEGLCLEFVNTMAWRLSETPEERLPSPSSLLDWCRAAGVLSAGQTARLESRWRARPEQAQAAHQQAVTLREAIYRVFRARLLSRTVPDDALRIFNGALAETPPRIRIAADEHGLGWATRQVEPTPASLLLPVLWSAADLMTGPHAERVRQCEDDRGCGWLFLDESRAGNRRWCSMGSCGNRAKARRYRGRHADM